MELNRKGKSEKQVFLLNCLLYCLLNCLLYCLLYVPIAGVWVVHLALLLVPTSALVANATPLGKVELLTTKSLDTT